MHNPHPNVILPMLRNQSVVLFIIPPIGNTSTKMSSQSRYERLEAYLQNRYILPLPLLLHPTILAFQPTFIVKLGIVTKSLEKRDLPFREIECVRRKNYPIISLQNTESITTNFRMPEILHANPSHNYPYPSHYRRKNDQRRIITHNR